ncbi:DUF5777 family beta-barrel protein [Sphingobacterium siyangense]|uniref:DUF5777 family beta-barrel protein n=2 Tax=Sphingobacterium TaxID=28453 RepID=UPI002FDD0D61
MVIFEGIYRNYKLIPKVNATPLDSRSTFPASSDKSSAASFEDFNDRLSYVTQLIITRKFSSNLSLVVVPTYLHRNYTTYNDQNDVFALGIGGRAKVSNRIALVADYTFPFRKSWNKKYREDVSGQRYYNALGVGLEMDTGGHIFHLNFTNATAIQESQFISETNSSWGKGQFRWGFSIARRFNFNKK